MRERRLQPFRQSDLTRAIRGATAGGMPVARVEIEPGGKIVILAASSSAEPADAFDLWEASDGARSS